MESVFRHKTVLITAGPTWVPIDKVRVISNTATGKTGILFAKKLKQHGAKVTLVLGPCQEQVPGRGVRLIRFRFFSELEKIIKSELKKKKYDIVIHSAAVSDYCLKKVFCGKIASDLKSVSIRLVRTPKIINKIRRFSSRTFLIGFKFKPDASVKVLKREADKLKNSSDCDLVVANTVKNRRYEAYIIDGEKILGHARSRSGLVDLLIGKLI